MFTIASPLYMPIKMNIKDGEPARNKRSGKFILGFVVSSTTAGCRAKFVEEMNLPWKDLFKEGWRIKPVDIDAYEGEFYTGYVQ